MINISVLSGDLESSNIIPWNSSKYKVSTHTWNYADMFMVM